MANASPGATEFDIDVTAQIEPAEKAAAPGMELFVMGDGWFGARTYDAAGLGDWTPHPATVRCCSVADC